MTSAIRPHQTHWQGRKLLYQLQHKPVTCMSYGHVTRCVAGLSTLSVYHGHNKPAHVVYSSSVAHTFCVVLSQMIGVHAPVATKARGQQGET